MGLVFWAPGMVSATDMTLMLLCKLSRLKGTPDVKVMVLGSHGSSRKALSLNLQWHEWRSDTVSPMSYINRCGSVL